VLDESYVVHFAVSIICVEFNRAVWLSLNDILLY
jgi:hypothetical protein